MKVFSVLVLCLCTGSCVAQGAASATAHANAAPTAAVDAVPADAAAGAADRVLNAPWPDVGYPYEEHYNPRGVIDFFVPNCRDCPENKMCRGVGNGKFLCYVEGNRDCDPTPDSGCKRKSYWVRWYYDHPRGQCTKFLYGGCGGNKNNFRSFRECERICSSRRPDRRDNVRNDHGYYERYERRGR